MKMQRKTAKRGGFTAGLLCAGAALLIAAPSAGLALGAIGMGDTAPSFGSFTPASMNPELARLVDKLDSDLMRFTPAGAANRTGRSVTVAVRVDDNVARAISVRQALIAAGEPAISPATRLAPTRYNLGLSRGYQSFARTPAVPSASLAGKLSDAAIPDLASFQPSPGVKEKPSRFAARIELDDGEQAGRAPRTRDALGDQTVDVGGSYSLTRNLNVTAGVRYSQDRDRLDVLSEGKQDSQAVYVGTQIRF